MKNIRVRMVKSVDFECCFRSSNGELVQHMLIHIVNKH